MQYDKSQFILKKMMHSPTKWDIPMTELPACEGSDEIKCQVANTGSILDFVGDRVHGWDRSSSFITRFGLVRIGLGAAITLSWLLVVGVLGKSGGVLRRGTPAILVDLVGKNNDHDLISRQTSTSYIGRKYLKQKLTS